MVLQDGDVRYGFPIDEQVGELVRFRPGCPHPISSAPSGFLNGGPAALRLPLGGPARRVAAHVPRLVDRP